MRGSNDGLWDWNVLTDEVYYSPRFKELLGYADHEMDNVFASFEGRLHPDDRQETLDAVRVHLQESRPYDVQYRLRTKAGDYRWFRARGLAVRSEDGRATRMAGSITDITEQKRLQRRFELAVQASPAALLMTDAEGKIVLVNSECARQFGYQRGELLGEPIERLVPPRLRDAHARPWATHSGGSSSVRRRCATRT